MIGPLGVAHLYPDDDDSNKKSANRVNHYGFVSVFII